MKNQSRIQELSEIRKEIIRFLFSNNNAIDLMETLDFISEVEFYG